MLKSTIADLNKKHILVDGKRVSFKLHHKDLKVIYYIQKDLISKVVTIPEAEKDFSFTARFLVGFGINLIMDTFIKPDELEG